MRSIKILLKLKASEMTAEELAYLEKYKQEKNLRHSTRFITHAKFLPTEELPDGN